MLLISYEKWYACKWKNNVNWHNSSQQMVLLNITIWCWLQRQASHAVVGRGGLWFESQANIATFQHTQI